MPSTGAEAARGFSYTVHLKRSAEKELDSIAEPSRGRIIKRLSQLAANPRPAGTKKLQGSDGFRVRIGDYRVLFVIDDQAKRVEVVAVGHRREVYR